MQAQTIKPVGAYHLRGVMEVASGFKLNEDSSFQFFFSYGALDRFGEGRWTRSGEDLILNSRKKPEHDFALVRSSHENNNRITLKILDGDAFMRSHVYAVIKAGNKQQDGAFDKEGILSFASDAIDSLELFFEFCPEKSSKFLISSKDHNYFEFRFEPWMMEVFFQNYHLQLTSDGLKGGHPLLKGNSFEYEKAN